MKLSILVAAVAGVMIAPCALVAQAPAGATGQCKDKTYTTAASKQGACRGHKGVATWYAETSRPAQAPPSKAALAPAPAPAAVSTPAPQPVTQPAPAAARTVPVSTPPPPQAKPARIPPQAQTGGAPGLVWVNTPTNVYHCYGARYYGTTKSGRYMTEADARAAGARPDHNTPCSK